MMMQNTPPGLDPPHSPRARGQQAMSDLFRRIPEAFLANMGTRRFLLSLPRWTAFVPADDAAPRPWLPDTGHEEGRELVISYRVEDSDVDYYLGFLDALVEYYQERCFISVQTLRNELIFHCVFET